VVISASEPAALANTLGMPVEFFVQDHSLLDCPGEWQLLWLLCAFRSLIQASQTSVIQLVLEVATDLDAQTSSTALLRRSKERVAHDVDSEATRRVILPWTVRQSNSALKALSVFIIPGHADVRDSSTNDTGLSDAARS